MGIPTVYRWDDLEAPVGAGTGESVNRILTACLVDGYGDKPGAGWTREFASEDNLKVAYRNDSIEGTGMFLKVDSTYANPLNSDSQVTGYESMSGVDDGTGVFLYLAYSYIKTSNQSESTQARPWVLIADNRFFYFISWSEEEGTVIGNKSYRAKMLAFGDIVSQYDPDPYGCFLSASASGQPGGYLAYMRPPSIVGGTEVFARTSDGLRLNVESNIVNGGGPCATTMGGEGSLYDRENPNAYPLYVSKPYLDDGESYTVRGWMPGLHYPCHVSPFNNFEVVEVMGKKFLALNVYRYTSPASILIEIEADWRA